MDDSSLERRRAALKKSPSYIKAYQDIQFLDRDDLRPVRLQLELLKPELIQIEQGIRSTIVVFGGTRVGPVELTQAKIRGLERRLKARPRDRTVAAELAIARRVLAKAKYY